VLKLNDNAFLILVFIAGFGLGFAAAYFYFKSNEGVIFERDSNGRIIGIYKINVL